MARRRFINRSLLQLLSIRSTILFTFTAIATAVLFTVFALMPGPRSFGFCYTARVSRDSDGSLAVNLRGTSTLALAQLDGSWTEDGWWAPTSFRTMTKLTISPFRPNELLPEEIESVRRKTLAYLEVNLTEPQCGLNAVRRVELVRRSGLHRETLYSGYFWNAAAILTGAAAACGVPLSLLRSFELAFHRQVRAWKETGQCTHCGYTLGADLAICPECGNTPSPL